MAGGSVIGALRVVLGADTVALEKGLKDAQSKVAAFGAALQRAAVPVGLAIGAALGGIGVAIAKSISDIDKFGESAEKLGIPVDELSRLRHAAEMSGTTFEKLSASLGTLSRNMSAVAGGATNTASRAFEAMGIKVQNADKTLKSHSQVLDEVAAKFERYREGPEKAALAMAIFGSAGAELIPMLNRGAQGLAKVKQEADELGIVISDKTAKAASDFSDNLDRMGKIKDGIITQLTAKLLPAFQNLSSVLLTAAKNSALMEATAKTLAVTLQGLITIAVAVGAAFKIAAGNIMAVAQALMQAATGDFSGAWETLKTGVVDAVTTMQGAAGIIKDIWTGPANEIAAAAPDLSNKMAAPIIQSVDKAKQAMKAMDQLFAGFAKRRATMEAETQTIGLGAGALEEAKVRQQALNLAKEKGIAITDALRARIETEATAMGRVAENLEGLKERYSEFQSQVQGVRSSLENAFVDAITQAKSFKDVINGLLKDLARMAAQAAFRAIFGGAASWGSAAGGIFNSGAGAGLLGGLLPGFAGGGSFEVGGTGGIDSQVVAFRGTPGERVTISKRDQMASGGVTLAPVFNIDARGSTMTPQEFRSIMEANNKMLLARVPSLLNEQQLLRA